MGVLRQRRLQWRDLFLQRKGKRARAKLRHCCLGNTALSPRPGAMLVFGQRRRPAQAKRHDVLKKIRAILKTKKGVISHSVFKISSSKNVKSRKKKCMCKHMLN